MAVNENLPILPDGVPPQPKCNCSARTQPPSVPHEPSCDVIDWYDSLR